MEAGRDVGGLALSCVQIENPMSLVRASLRNAFTRVGVSIPWFAVHDVGTLMTTDARAWTLIVKPRQLAAPMNFSHCKRFASVGLPRAA